MLIVNDRGFGYTSEAENLIFLVDDVSVHERHDDFRLVDLNGHAIHEIAAAYF